VIGVTEIDIPDDFPSFQRIMEKVKKENHTLLININEQWVTGWVDLLDRNWVDIKLVNRQLFSLNKTNYEKERSNLKNATYYIEDLFYKIANSHN